MEAKTKELRMVFEVRTEVTPKELEQHLFRLIWERDVESHRWLEANVATPAHWEFEDDWEADDSWGGG